MAAIACFATPLPSEVRTAVAAFLIYDVLVAHFAHLLDEDVGAVPRGRLTASRSFMLAILNVVVLIFAWATAFQAATDLGPARSVGASWGAMTTLDIVAVPDGTTTSVLQALAVTSSLFMLTIVITTVLAGFDARPSVKRRV